MDVQGTYVDEEKSMDNKGCKNSCSLRLISNMRIYSVLWFFRMIPLVRNMELHFGQA